MSEPRDYERVVLCQACGSEGRILEPEYDYYAGHVADRDLGPCPYCDGTGGEVITTEILSGDDAEEAFGHLTLHDPEEMRRETERAFLNIRREIYTAANPLLLVGLLNRGKQ